MKNLSSFKQLGSCLLLASLCLSPISAKSDNKKSIPMYQVEMIVFEHLDKSGLEEAWPLEPGKPNIDNAQSPVEANAQNTEQEEEPGLDTQALNASDFEPSSELEPPQKITVPEFLLIPSTELQLEDAKARLKAKGSYKIIAHKAWRQPIHHKKEAQPMRFSAGKSYGQQNTSYSSDNYQMDESGYKDNDEENNQSIFEIDGTVMLTRSQYLHVSTDLIFTKPMRVLTPAAGSQSAVKLTNVRNRNNWERESNARLQPFRLKQLVRIRKSEVQYIDHPMYGVLITVMSVD